MAALQSKDDYAASKEVGWQNENISNELGWM